MKLTEMHVDQHAVQQFVQASLAALIRKEIEGALPPRFTDAGVDIWNTFRNELTMADLAALALQDVGAAMPIPFDPRHWWPDWPEWVLFQQDADAVAGWVQTALALAELSQDAYLRAQATFLAIDLPADADANALPAPQSHERWLELPGTGGWLSYNLCQRPDTRLYLWENFTIVCATPQEKLFAGLVAWTLNAPPRTALPIILDGDLMATLKDTRRYDAVIGRHDLHGHRDLRILHREGKEPLWI